MAIFFFFWGKPRYLIRCGCTYRRQVNQSTEAEALSESTTARTGTRHGLGLEHMWKSHPEISASPIQYGPYCMRKAEANTLPHYNVWRTPPMVHHSVLSFQNNIPPPILINTLNSAFNWRKRVAEISYRMQKQDIQESDKTELGDYN